MGRKIHPINVTNHWTNLIQELFAPSLNSWRRLR